MSRIKPRLGTHLYDEVLATREALLESNDCAVIAISIATDTPYERVHALLAKKGRRRHGRTSILMTLSAITELGYVVLAIEPEQIVAQYPKGRVKGITTYHPRSPEFAHVWEQYKDDALLLRCSGHILALKDGVVQDWSNGRALRVKEIWKVVKKGAR